MTKKWVPVYGTYDCPGRIRLKVDELGIVIERGKKALATTEWPGENIRICELVEETKNVRRMIWKPFLDNEKKVWENRQSTATIAEDGASIHIYIVQIDGESIDYTIELPLEGVRLCRKVLEEGPDTAPLTAEARQAVSTMMNLYYRRYGPTEGYNAFRQWLDSQS